MACRYMKDFHIMQIQPGTIVLQTTVGHVTLKLYKIKNQEAGAMNKNYNFVQSVTRQPTPPSL